MLECKSCIKPKTANFVQHVCMNIWYWIPLVELNYIRHWKDVNFFDSSRYEVLKIRFCALRRAKFVNIDFRQKTHKLKIPSRILTVYSSYVFSAATAVFFHLILPAYRTGMCCSQRTTHPSPEAYTLGCRD